VHGVCPGQRAKTPCLPRRSERSCQCITCGAIHVAKHPGKTVDEMVTHLEDVDQLRAHLQLVAVYEQAWSQGDYAVYGQFSMYMVAD